MAERLPRARHNEQMHIAHVTSFYSLSALTPSSAVRARGIAYRSAGHEFSVIVPGTVSAVTWTEYGTVITVAARRAALRRGFVPIPLAIRRAIDRLVPDRLEVADRLSFRQLGVWARENQVPAVLFAEEIPADWFTDGALASYDIVVHNSRTEESSPARTAENKAAAIPQGVDIEIFTPLRHNPALRDRSGAELVVVCAAPLTVAGAMSSALEATRRLAAQGHDVHLVVVGDGPLRSRLERSASGLPVLFLSAQDLSLAERAEVFATADFALVTMGGTAGHGLALEALASGTPVIASGPAQHPIDFCFGGGLSTDSDPAHIANAIVSLAMNSVESRRLAARQSSLPFDAMPLNRAMIALHESLE
ncbi:alpha-1,6-mannosyltransferase [Rhodoglobus vestalii]|uniref:D-inositol 3-phosphate glycosyltransferase n=1 Tax=Rhodoglobus vestalii TaxID=193384 RepID=A0A8H2K3S3_9MICO|nr:alpha-1,6-mannosyltransferase [Rhodoglobus vestalii]